jgi:hypothetical protein
MNWRRELEEMLAVEAPGSTLVKTNGGHIRITLPSGVPVFCASTPSDNRAFRNIRAVIRREQRRKR